MAVLNRNDYFETLTKLIGDNASPEATKALEDFTDTYNSLEKGINSDGIDWKKKCEETEKSWSARYRARFFGGDGGSGPAKEEPGSQSASKDPEKITINDLFTVTRK